MALASSATAFQAKNTIRKAYMGLVTTYYNVF